MDELNLIMISTSMHEYAAIAPISFECEVGTGDASNDFELRGYDVFTGGVYIPGTEYGGLIECPEDTTGAYLQGMDMERLADAGSRFTSGRRGLLYSVR